MSAECSIHGCDLTGHEFSEGGLRCPQCDRDAEIAKREAVIERLATWIEAHVEGAQVYRETGLVVT